MRKISLLIFCLLFIVILTFLELEMISFYTQLYLSIFLIMLIGVPHGAIDHVLFVEKNNGVGKNSTSEFYTLYFGLMIFYFVAWMLVSTLSLIVFLSISAFHFGQSQFADLSNINRSKSIFINISWGVSILSGLLLYNYIDVFNILNSSPDLSGLVAILDLDLIALLLSTSSVAAVVSIIWLGYNRKVSEKRVGMELLTLVLIHLCFYIMPIVIGFTIFFVTIHSLTVMSEEFKFLKRSRANFSVLQFVQLLLPFTLLSVLGSGLLIIITKMGDIGISDILLIFILLSLVTLPHSVVMDEFYEKVHRVDSSN